MHLSEAGVPPLAFAQMLASSAIAPDAAARFRAIMARAGTDEATLIQRDVQAPLRWFREVYPDLASDQATELGLACAEQAQVTSFGPLSLPLVSAGSVSEIVELLTFLPLISTAVSPRFHRSERGLSVELIGHADDPDLDRLAITYAGSALLRLLELLVGDVSAATLNLTGPVPARLARHEDVLAGRLVFDAPRSFLHLSAEALEAVCRFADPLAYRHAITELQRALERRGGATSFSETVRQLLDAGTGLGSSQAVAAELSMSVSTLKRRLCEEGTSFRELREESLRERAVRRLLDRSVSVSEVATDLGYSDLTNFSHAFKRWTGESPTQFRRSRHSA